MISPRIRPELTATPIEDDGLAFFDVRDPSSGVTMRLYDHEWQLAYQMDGQLTLEEIATWANGVLALHVTEETLQAYAEQLRDLGFVDASDVPTAMAPRDPYSLSGATTPLPPPSPSYDDVSEDVPIELTEDEEQVTEQQIALPHRPEPEAISPPPRERADATQRSIATAPMSAAPAATAGHEEGTAPASGSSRSMLGLLVVLLIIGAIVAYVTLMGAGAKVSTQVTRTRDVVALHDGSAKLSAAPARTLSFGESGKVSDIVAAGTEIKAGQALATLESYSKVEKELADVKDRLGFYQKELEKATQKGNAEAQKSAEEKVAEKKKLLGDLETRAEKLRLVAPGPGTVEKIDVANGSDVKADAPIVELHDNRVIAAFTLPGAALAAIKVGDEVSVQDLQGATAAGKVSKIDGGAVTVELADGATLKPGDEVRLVKSKLSGVAVIPSSAVVKKDGADTVFVLSAGVAHAKKVTIADRAGGEVYVSSGLQAGDQVVTSGGDALHDGDKASAGQ